jgi:hypothetical protein
VTQAAVVDEDGSELSGRQSPSNGRLAHVVDAVEQAPVQHNRDAGTTGVLEVDPSPVDCVRCARNGASLLHS